MKTTTFLLGICGLPSFLAAAETGAASGIDHKPIGCIVAGKFPTFQACFGSNTPQARVYFRAQGGPSWYSVLMKPQGSCEVGILPKPKRGIGGINYYIETIGRAMQSVRTEEFAPRVVDHQGECEKDKPVAAPVDSASVVLSSAAGAPAVPVGFTSAGIAGAGGLSPLAIAGLTVAGGGAAGGALLAASGDDPAPVVTAPPTTIAVTPNPPSPAIVETPTPTPASSPTPRSANRPPTLVLTVSPDPPVGSTSLTVHVNLCRSFDPDPNDELRFSFAWGDGSPRDGGPCNQGHTYSVGALARGARLGTEFEATFCVRDGIQEPEHEVCDTRRVVLEGAPVEDVPTCAADHTGPSVTLIEPEAEWHDFSGTMAVEANASDPSGLSKVDFFAGDNSPEPRPTALIASVSGGGPAFFASATMPSDCEGEWRVFAVATDACGNTTTTPAVSGLIDNDCGGDLAPRPELTFRSTLELTNGAAQLTLNGSGQHVLPRGNSAGAVSLKGGENRVELQVTKAGGQAGTWHFQVAGARGWKPASVHVTAGQVVSITSDTIVVRLKGVVGERVSFSFEATEP